ncbi:hypothetical protein SNE40_014484 [Patella caerulea]|uniref:Uncharacterized protein n=1 Tax=Patella caerulea TaxID=87958 RepID=A0AAN8PTA7_PATCE
MKLPVFLIFSLCICNWFILIRVAADGLWEKIFFSYPGSVFWPDQGDDGGDDYDAGDPLLVAYCKYLKEQNIPSNLCL